LHGALLDAQLLATVYLELIGGRQHGLGLTDQSLSAGDQDSPLSRAAIKNRPYREPRLFSASPKEEEDHQKMIESLKSPLWLTA
jgi:DNA polymerase-3 subunit epsilon